MKNIIFSTSKYLFYFSFIILLILYLFPGSLIGFFLYGNLGRQPDLISNPLGTSINHLIFFFYLSILGFFLRIYALFGVLFTGLSKCAGVPKWTNIMYVCGDRMDGMGLVIIGHRYFSVPITSDMEVALRNEQIQISFGFLKIIKYYVQIQILLSFPKGRPLRPVLSLTR